MCCRTPLCDLLGIDFPIVQAPIGSATTPELAAAVSNRGGLGTLAVSWSSTTEVALVVERTRHLTPRPFAANLVLEWPQTERARIAVDLGVPVISTSWGDPTDVFHIAQEAGAKCVHSVGSADEVPAALAAGAHVLVAQGAEAGGHVRATRPLEEVLRMVLEVAGTTPVVAAGGIATGREIAELMNAGAAGVWMGTRFLCTYEAGADPEYQRAIVAAAADDTVLTYLFDGGWPNAQHRVLKNSTYAAWEAAGCPDPGRRPGEGDVVARLPDGRPVSRYDDVIPVRGVSGDREALAMYAGTSAGNIDKVVSVATLMDELVDGFT